MYNIKLLSEAVGAEIYGIKLHANMSKDEVLQMQNLILEHKVVVFRDQSLTPEAQIATVGQFGEIAPHPLQKNTCPYSEMTYVSNVAANGEALGYPGPKFSIWHTDLCYLPNPPKFSFLYAEKVPDQGGNTLFCNSTQAYEDLPTDIKLQLENVNAVFGFSSKLMERCKKKGYDLIIDEVDQSPDIVHPVFRVHPLTGKKSIFVNWTHTDSIVGFSAQDSERMLKYLYNFCLQNKYIYCHKYNKDDLIVWDNSATLHTGDGAIAIDKPRIMRRVVVNF